MTIGEKILNMRKARGWSQEELAERIGVSRQAVSRWEADSAKPDADRIIAICDLFGMSADYLLRDMAAGERTERVSVPPAVRTVPKPWLAWGMTAFGAVTLFILRILASVNRTYISPAHELSSDGTVSIHIAGYYTGFGYYIEEHGLEWMVWLASLGLIIGSGRILWRKYREWKTSQIE